MPQKLTHFDDGGNAVMVDVSTKSVTARTATAKGRVMMHSDTAKLIASRGHKKGDVLAISQLAGIMGAKRTADLIPLCHPLPLDSVSVTLTLAEEEPAVDITATCKTSGRTGVEMEALTAVSVTALTVFDMCKAVDKTMQLTNIRVIYKEGGKSGTFTAD
ncbi:molybdenum cofactor biosynthesis protein MoaC [Thalassospira profundimaris]|uniref:Cyclic pyranopterin monophosphate synthase n=1 Tax=Thalassospira profundimaris TaxID=502049 RepID=A0A367XHD2_9PROT|nr:cyclic pyranopterin monophosphate synthase MoaC [Thalassospira profundimaris]RCK52540.1 molybdenum cofactor biosynthesis protein MoaC [Thalassospira profundimaris]